MTASTRYGDVLVVCGVPASGKTTFATQLARRLHWTYLDLDTVTNPLFEYVGGEYLVDVPTAQPRAAGSINDVRYTCLYDTAGENLRLGNNVVMVAPFTSERTYASAWGTVAQRLDVPPEFVHLAWMDTPAAEILDRMRRRGAARDLDKIAHPEVYLTVDVLAAPAVEHFRIDGTTGTAAQVDAFLAEFDARVTAFRRGPSTMSVG